MALYGFLLVPVPVMGGGLLALILDFAGVPRDIAVWAGLGIVGFASCVFALFIARIHRMEMKLARRRFGDDIATGIAQILTFDVRRAWEVDGLDDLGPGFLFETSDHDFVYAATQYFLDSDEGTYPSKRIAIERLPVSKSIVGVKHEGDYLAPEAGNVTVEELGVLVDCDVLERGKIPVAVRTKLRIA
jgi:hypothetical protein